MPVDILMATYNGERYLHNQILSLQQQTYEDWTLLIRDDLDIHHTFRDLLCDSKEQRHKSSVGSSDT